MINCLLSLKFLCILMYAMEMPFIQSAFYFMRNAHELVGQKVSTRKIFNLWLKTKTEIDLLHCRVNFIDDEIKIVLM